MVTETISFFINGPHGYGAETVSELRNGEWPQFLAYPNVLDLTFSHVLSVPTSEEVWPGDAAELFFPELFAMRYVGEDLKYRLCGEVWEHMREELLRLADVPETRTLDSMWTSDFMLYLLELGSPKAAEFFFGLETGCTYHEKTADYRDPFCDGSDDEYDEEDTLNSELLLPDEYLPPRPKEGTQDRKSLAEEIRDTLQWYLDVYDGDEEFEQNTQDTAPRPTSPGDTFHPTERKGH